MVAAVRVSEVVPAVVRTLQQCVLHSGTVHSIDEHRTISPSIAGIPGRWWWYNLYNIIPTAKGFPFMVKQLIALLKIIIIDFRPV